MGPANLVFALNGERVELENVDPSGTLIQYLRLQSKYKGTKLACGEGTACFETQASIFENVLWH